MAEHIPCVRTTDCNIGDSVHCTRLNAPFFGGTFSILCGVECFPNICFKRIVQKVIIARADVGVTKPLFYAHERRVIVFGCIFVIDDDGYVEFAFKIEEILFFIANNNCDIADTSFLKLPDLAFDENLPTYLQKAFGFFIGNGRKST